jgi:hypothetical protein
MYFSEGMALGTEDWAFLISGVSLAVAIAGFIWRIFEKYIYVKPALQIGFAVMTTFPGPEVHLLALSVTNMGPGAAVIYNCMGYSRRRWWEKKKYGILNPIEGNPAHPDPATSGPFSAGLPLRIDAADTKTFYFPHRADGFLSKKLQRIGVLDTYNRYHWCQRRAMKRVMERFRRDFPDVA